MSVADGVSESGAFIGGTVFGAFIVLVLIGKVTKRFRDKP